MKHFFRVLVEPLRRLGLLLGRVNTFIILSISYYLVLMPVGLVRRLFTEKHNTGTWNERPPLKPDHFEKQF